MNTEEVAKTIDAIRNMQVASDNMVHLYAWDSRDVTDMLHAAHKNIQEAMLHASARLLEETRK